MKNPEKNQSKRQFEEAVRLHREKKWPEAIRLYRAVIERDPQHANAWGNLGSALKVVGEMVESERCTTRASELAPNDYNHFYNLANLLRETGKLHAAVAAYRTALSLAPGDAGTWHNLAITLGEMGESADERLAYRQAIAANPDHLEARLNLAISYSQFGEVTPAQSELAALLERAPNYAPALNNLAEIYRDCGRIDEALKLFHRAIVKQPQQAQSQSNLVLTYQYHPDRLDAELFHAAIDWGKWAMARTGASSPSAPMPEEIDHLVALFNQGRYAEVEALARKLTALFPQDGFCWKALANALLQQGRSDEALAPLEKAALLLAGDMDVHSNLGVLLRRQGRLAESEASYRQALQIKPDYAEAHYNLGNVLKDQGRLTEAETSYRRALEIKPDYEAAHTNLLLALNYIAGHSPSSFLDQARHYGVLVASRVKSKFNSWTSEPRPKRLRVGLVSGDLRNHPVGYFLENLLAQIDPQRIELIAYPTDNNADDLTARIKARFASWKPIFGLSDEAAASLIHTDGVHVLLDLAGHLAENRLPVFAAKPAPIQVSWLGYFATTGLAEIDYLLADEVGVPIEQRAQFAESVWYLPDTRLCFTPPQSDLPVSPLPALANGYLTFACFQIYSKLSDGVLAAWAKILAALPKAVLRVQCVQFSDSAVRAGFVQRLGLHGIEPDRVTMHGAIPRQAYLATYAEVDVILDTFPYPGGTTTCEALWMGVPTLTLAGDRLLARQGASLLTAAGLANWVATSEDDYVVKAVALASDLAGLAHLRSGLRAQMLVSPLCDAARFARNFETALWGMWQRWEESQGPIAYTGQSGAETPPATPSTEDTAQLLNLFNEGRYAELETLAHSLTGRFAQDGFSWKALATALLKQGRSAEALVPMQKAAELLPRDAEVYCSLGIILKEQGRLTAAEASYRKALEIDPESAHIHSNLAVCLMEQARLDEAIACCQEALRLDPGNVGAQINLGNIFLQLDRLSEAEASYRRVLNVSPESAEAQSNLGVTLQEQGRLLESETRYRRALTLSPNYAEAHGNLGVALKEQGRLSEAEASYRRALALKPDYTDAYSNLLLDLNYADTHSAQFCLEEAKRYGQMVESKVSARFSAWNVTPTPQRLRVGLVSGDLLGHPVGYFLEGLLAQLDPARIELMAYPTKHKTDDLSERLKPHFAAWKPIFNLDDQAAAALIHADGVHVLLDLAGHTAHNRLPIFAWKPAPVQVSWLGYFATTGLATMDYLIADPWTLPKAEEIYFTEEVWRLPQTRLCFTAPDVDVEVAPLPALANGYVTFGCFNNLAKVNDAVVALWSRVLAAVPGSRLLLKTKQLNDPLIQESVAARFTAQGIAADRLTLEGPDSRPDYLAAYGRVDIALDPFPFPGGATSAEGLWMGVPVLTLAGERFVSRQGLGLLINAGLPDWIATDADEYVAKAVLHSTNLERLATLRAGLRQQVLASPLFDASRFARHFESALYGMWQKWCDQQEGQPQ